MKGSLEGGTLTLLSIYLDFLLVSKFDHYMGKLMIWDWWILKLLMLRAQQL